MEVTNNTPYQVERVFQFDRNGAETLVVAIKGTFDIKDGALAIAEDQAPVCTSDEYCGDPGNSSIKEACDLLLPKPFTDIFVSGEVQARDTNVRQQGVHLQVGQWQRQLVISGERRGYGAVNRPEPFESIPLVWENAFGGVDCSPENEADYEFSAANPIGKGFIASKSKLKGSNVQLPNIEPAQALLRSEKDRPQPFATSPIPPFWMPRKHYGGTYDDQWRRNRSPLVPTDFDERFYQAACAGMHCDGYLQGTEACLFSGINRDRDLAFHLNTTAPQIRLRLANKGSRTHGRLETLHLFPNQNRLTITWKAAFNVHGRVEQIRQIDLGFVA